MLDNKTIPEKISFEEEVRAAIEGYRSLYPLDSSNFFYDNYKRSWNNLRDDLDEHKGLDSRTSYLTIMSAARKDRDELFLRCNKQLIKVEELVNTFIDYLKKYSESLSGKEYAQVEAVFKSWEINRAHHNYCMLSTMTNIKLLQFDLTHIPVEKPWEHLHRYIGESMKLLDKRVKKLAKIYALYWGMDNAITCVVYNDRIYECDKFIEEYFSYEEFNTDKQQERNIRTLMTLGHNLKTAINLRFWTFHKKKDNTQVEAHQLIREELVDLGIEPDDMEDFPGPKALAERVRRYMSKRFKQLSTLGVQ